MNFEYKELLPKEFNADSRVWIYQSNRLFSLSEALEIEDRLHEFVQQWQSHGVPVKGYGNLFFGQFILLMADETATGVSGCSTDSSVRLIKQIESDLKVQLFDRQSLAFVSKNKVELVPLSQVDYAAENHFIEADTLYFNNTIQTKEELENRWIIPIKESWLSKKIQFKNPVIS